MKINRRNFLSNILVGSSVAVLNQMISACNIASATFSATNTSEPTKITVPVTPSSTIPAPTSLPTQANITTTTPSPSPTQVPNTPTAVPTPDLVIARGGQPEDLVRKAIAALGGMGKFVAKGSNVVVKPNICVGYFNYEYAATTNPWVVAAVVKLAFEAGAKTVKVMDFPFGSPAKEAYTKSGIEEQVKAAGGEMVVMTSYKFVATDLPKGKILKKTEIYDDILKADVIINVPIAKHHNLALLTLGLKNLLGIVRERSSLHTNLGQNLVDIYSRVHPVLNIIDAVRILMRNGPSGGNINDVKKLDTVIASTDIVAADSYAASLFNVKPETLDYIKAGVAAGIGQSDLKNIKIQEIP